MKYLRFLMSSGHEYCYTLLFTQRIPQFLLPRQEASPAATNFRFLRHFHSRPRTRNLLTPITEGKSGTIKDEDIRTDIIQVVNENGRLGPPVRTADTLRSLQRDKYSLVQVSPGSVDRPPVCKILSKEVIREQQRAKEKAPPVKKRSTKQIELNWAIDPHDLAHRLKSLTGFIEKGQKVEVILTRKRGKRPPTNDEVKNVMDTVMEEIDKANAVQIEPMEGQLGKHVVVVVKRKGRPITGAKDS
jgi:translation initiation factor IF-3